MVASKTSQKIERSLERGDWDTARALIKAELRKHSDNHWLLTQLGVTYYEQKQYRKSLRPFLEALEIVPDCPLTLWNVAGVLDAVGKSDLAVQIYFWILKSQKSAADDPCWESSQWTESLKVDCVYRLGLCFQHLKQDKSADHCFRQYINLLLAGLQGSYSIDEAAKHILKLHPNGKQSHAKELREVIESTFPNGGGSKSSRGRAKLPHLSIDELLAASR